MTSDMSKCINCGMCVRACDEVQGDFVLSMAGRGFDSHIIKGLDTTFEESPCVSCGACAQACPTIAISDIFAPLRPMANTTTRTTCTYCGVGCNLEVSTLDNEIMNILRLMTARSILAMLVLKVDMHFSFITIRID